MSLKSFAIVFCGLLALSTAACREHTYELWNEEDQAPWMRNVLTAEVTLPVTGTETTKELSQLLGRAAAVPGVEQVAVANVLPGAPAQRHRVEIQLEGSPSDQPSQGSCLIVSPGYFKTIDLRLIQGRFFSENDNASGPYVAIVNESYARSQNPDGSDSLLGKRVKTGRRSELFLTIIGIVQDRPGAERNAELYLPYSQYAALAARGRNREVGSSWYLLVRTSGGDQQGIATALRGALGLEIRPIQERLEAYREAHEK